LFNAENSCFKFIFNVLKTNSDIELARPLSHGSTALNRLNWDETAFTVEQVEPSGSVLKHCLFKHCSFTGSGSIYNT
jgi:hypothetical protein